MNEFLGLKLKLSLKDDSIVEGTVHAISPDSQQQQISLRQVRLMKAGLVVAQFPELTVNGAEIGDVEIVNSSTSGSGKTSKGASASKKSNPNSNSNYNPNSNSTPSSKAKPIHTFPTGNARQNLPREDFDFAAAAARFDKARVFADIAREDVVRPEDRLVSINSPQRKLAINEDVLDATEAAGNNIVRAAERRAEISKSTLNTSVSPSVSNSRSTKLDSITAKLMGMSPISSTSSKSPLLIVEDSDSTDDDDSNDLETYGLPVISEEEYSQLQDSLSDSDRQCQAAFASASLSHHVLPGLLKSKQPLTIIALLGVEEEAQYALQFLSQLSNHGRLAGASIYACFAVGGTGKRVEQSLPLKTLKAQLMGRVRFLASLSEICVKAREATAGTCLIIDALRETSNGGLLSPTTRNTLSTLLHQQLTSSPGNTRVLGFNGTILREGSRLPRLQIVSFGLVRRSVLVALSRAEGLLVVDTGFVPETPGSEELFKETFCCEIDY